MVTRFADRRRAPFVEEEGKDRRCSLGRRDVRTGITGEEFAIVAEGISDGMERRFGGKFAVSLLQGGGCPWSAPPIGHLKAATIHIDPHEGPCGNMKVDAHHFWSIPGAGVGIVIDKGRNISRSRSDPRPHPHRDEVPRVSTGVDLVIIG